MSNLPGRLSDDATPSSRLVVASTATLYHTQQLNDTGNKFVISIFKCGF